MMQAIIDAFSCLIGWLAAAFPQLFVDLFEAAGDLLVYLFDMAGDLVLSAINSFDWTWLGDAAAFWYSLPPIAVDVAAAVGLPQAFGIIVGASLVRFVLQLIPFVRLGS